MKTHDPKTTCLNSSTILSQQSLARYHSLLSALVGRTVCFDAAEIGSLTDFDGFCKDAIETATYRLIGWSRRRLIDRTHLIYGFDEIVQKEIHQAKDSLILSLEQQHRLAEADRTSDLIFFWIESFQHDIERYLVWVQARLQELCQTALTNTPVDCLKQLRPDPIPTLLPNTLPTV